MKTKEQTLWEKVKMNYKYLVIFVVVCLLAYLISNLPFVKAIDENAGQSMKIITDFTVDRLKENYSSTKDFVRVMFN